MRGKHGWRPGSARGVSVELSYNSALSQGHAAMFISLLLARLTHPRRYVWTPAIHVEDASIRSALIPDGMH